MKRFLKRGNMITSLAALALVMTLLSPVANASDSPRVIPIIEGLNYPSAMVVDASGAIYVSLINDDAVRIYAPSLAGTYTDQDSVPCLGFKHWPRGVAVDSQGALYVLDTETSTVRKYIHSVLGNWMEVNGLKIPEPPLSFVPTGLAVDPAGIIYVADSYGIHKYSQSGTNYLGPTDITKTPSTIVALDVHGNLYATASNSIVKYAAIGTGFAAPVTVVATEHVDALAIDASGSVYVADATNHAVHKYTSSGSAYSVQPDLLADPAWTPTAVGVDTSGNVYVADSASHIIAKFASSVAGYARQPDVASPGSLASPAGVAIDLQGNLYVADTNQDFTSGAVHKYGPSGAGYRLLPDIVPPHLYTPWGVAVDNNGNVYVTEIYGAGVHKYTPSGGGYVEQPMIANDSHFSGIAVDDAGNVYVCDFDGAAVRKYAPSGNGYTRLDDVAGNTFLGEPTAVAVDAAGVVYVADAYRAAILAFAPAASGYVLQLGPNGEREIVNSVNNPQGIAVDKNGTVIVVGSDGNNSLVFVARYGQGDTSQSTVMTSILRDWGIAPLGITLDSVGNMYLTDPDNNRVVKLSPIPKSTATQFYSSALSMTIGEPTSIQVRVIGNKPTGTVSFTMDGESACAAAPLSESGETNMAVAAWCGGGNLTSGQHVLAAIYSGDANNDSSSGSIMLTVNRTTPIFKISSNKFPATQGQGFTLTATLYPFSSYTGTVTFIGNGQPLCESVPLISSDGLNKAICVTAFTSTSTELITAQYSGDSYNTDMSTSISLPVNAGTLFDYDQHGITGSWFNPATSGQGIEFEVYPDVSGPGHGLLFGGWFTYDATAAGGRRWYGLTGDASNGQASATLQIFDIEGGNFSATPAVAPKGVLGQAVLSLSDCANGTLTYTFSDGSGRSGIIPLTRLTPNTTCSAAGDTGAVSDYLLSGNWYNPNTSGQGISFDFSPSIHTVVGAWYTFKPNGRAISSAASQDWFTLQSDQFFSGMTPLNGIPIIETSGGAFNTSDPTSSSQVGTAGVILHSCNAMTFAYRFTSGQNQGLTGNIELKRVGPTPAGCSL